MVLDVDVEAVPRLRHDISGFEALNSAPSTEFRLAGPAVHVVVKEMWSDDLVIWVFPLLGGPKIDGLLSKCHRNLVYQIKVRGARQGEGRENGLWASCLALRGDLGVISPHCCAEHHTHTRTHYTTYNATHNTMPHTQHNPHNTTPHHLANHFRVFRKHLPFQTVGISCHFVDFFCFGGAGFGFDIMTPQWYQNHKGKDTYYYDLKGITMIVHAPDA